MISTDGFVIFIETSLGKMYLYSIKERERKCKESWCEASRNHWHCLSFRHPVRKVCTSWVLSLVKCVAVWMPMLTHIQASHTDALKTHFTQNFSAALLTFMPCYRYRAAITLLEWKGCLSVCIGTIWKELVSGSEGSDEETDFRALCQGGVILSIPVI